MSSQARSPISFPVHVGRLPKNGFPVRVEADAAQRKALAELHGLEAVERFAADLTVREWKSEGVRVAGRLEADIVQNCIVTLDPLPASIREGVDEVFLPERSRLTRPGEGGEIMLDMEGADSPEPFSGDTIDVGALAEELFTLAIDPYPRGPEAELSAPVEEEADSAGDNTLRAQLQRLRSKQ